MPWKSKEQRLAHMRKPEIKAKKNATARAKYHSDPHYRKERIKQASSHRKDTVLGTVMSRLRINNHYSKKFGYSPCLAKAKDIIPLYNGTCDLCRTPSELKSLVIDHDHKTGAFRGWLCGGCNKGLGYFSDSRIKLLQATEYLYTTKTEDSFDIAPKESNPKDLIGSTKLPLSIIPGTTKAYLAIGHLEGNRKYGASNWRQAGVRMSIYLDALERHIEKLKGGEWSDQTTKIPHLANALCCLSIIVDAYECGKLVDDRPKSAPVGDVIDRMSENVKHIQNLFKDSKPTDYFITGPKERE